MTGRAVYAAINAIAANLALVGLAKRHTNEVDEYKYRSIDDVLDCLAPLLAKHQLCILPRATERVVTDRADEMQRLLVNVTLKVAFSLISAQDGSSHIVESYGEALDCGDKATAKAMSAAYKSAMVQTFCIPVSGADDPDRTGYKPVARIHDPEPVQGWAQWCADIEEIITNCQSTQAISTIQEMHRRSLTGLSREQPDLYRHLGAAFTARIETLEMKRIRKTRKAAANPRKAKAQSSAEEAVNA